MTNPETNKNRKIFIISLIIGTIILLLEAIIGVEVYKSNKNTRKRKGFWEEVSQSTH